MKALILAAGYGTRLYPLTKDRPKSLLPVGGRPLLDHLAENLDRVAGLQEILVAVNARFEDDLRGWADRVRESLGTPLAVISNGTETPEERLGAVGDVARVIDREDPADDLLVAAGDNLFEFEIAEMGRAAEDRPSASAVVAVERRASTAGLERSGVALVDEDGRVRRFVEKPDRPPGRTAAAPLHLYRRDALPLFEEFVDSGGETDAPGHFLEWLVPRREVWAWTMTGPRHDIGTPEAYRETRKHFARPSSRAPNRGER